MYSNLGELLSLLASAVGTVVFTGVGVLLERAGIRALESGISGFGLWEVAVGIALVYIGLYVIGYRTFWTGVRPRVLGE